MEKDECIKKEREYQENLLKAYEESKKLFIRAEERLPDMKFFVTPMLEHRDALEHLMRYMNSKQKGLEQDALGELDKALGHEIRAFFDVADFVCITVRSYISNSLNRIRKSKIKQVWKDYSLIRGEVAAISEEIAQIRMSRKGEMSYIEKYKDVVDKMFGIYENYITKIEPAIKKG